MKKNEKLTQNIEIEITEYNTCTNGFTCSWSGKEVMKSVRGDYTVRTRRPGRVRKDQLRHRHGRGRWPCDRRSQGGFPLLYQHQAPRQAPCTNTKLAAAIVVLRWDLLTSRVYSLPALLPVLAHYPHWCWLLSLATLMGMPSVPTVPIGVAPEGSQNIFKIFYHITLFSWILISSMHLFLG